MTSSVVGVGILNGNAPGAAYLQYGALGLCTLMVISAVWCIRETLKHLENKDKQMKDLVEKTIKSYDEMLEQTRRNK